MDPRPIRIDISPGAYAGPSGYILVVPAADDWSSQRIDWTPRECADRTQLTHAHDWNNTALSPARASRDRADPSAEAAARRSRMLMERVAGGGESGIAFASDRSGHATRNPTVGPTATMIVTQALTKRYGLAEALSGVSLEVRKGEVFGLLGPNGAGKTTTIRILLGLLRPTAGRATIAGYDCWAESNRIHRFVSFLPGEIRLLGHLTGLATLRYLSGLRDGLGLDRAVAIAERIMGLDLRRKVRTYSTGMKQKLALSQAFADPVDILILDEPTSALDPSARADVLGLVADAKSMRQTVIFSGHVLSEVEQVSDRVGILRSGKLMHVEDMHERRSLRMVMVRFAGPAPRGWPSDLQLSVREQKGDVILFEHRGEAGPLLTWLASQPVADFAVGTEELRGLYERYNGPGADGV
jgi:ABC-2 type transport system ATP-binding protein